MKKFILLVLLSFFCMVANAAQPTCHFHEGGDYCRYSGPVNKVYINSGNLILLYFDQAIDMSVANGFGMGITKGEAAAYRVDENPEFGRLFFATALTAQASGRDVVIHMRGSESGYLKFDRIWLHKPQ